MNGSKKMLSVPSFFNTAEALCVLFYDKNHAVNGCKFSVNIIVSTITKSPPCKKVFVYFVIIKAIQAFRTR